MKYLAYSLILIAFSASMFGQSKTVQTGYTHYETTADPKNGQSCVAGTAFCNGGGTTSTVIPSPDGCIPAKTVVTVTPGTYSNFIKGVDNNLSTLTSVLYTIKRKSDNVIIYSVTINPGGAWPTTPTQFTANLQVSPSTTGVPGTYYRSGNGILTIISPSIPGAAASNTETLIVSVDPTCSPIAAGTGPYTSAGGIDETFTQEYSETAVAAMSKTGKLIPGDVKYSELTNDHDGWYLMNGRNISGISNISAKQAATTIFGSTLPDMDNKYMIADYSTGTRMTTIGQNTFTVANANIQAATLSTTSNGDHSHTFNDYYGGANDNSGINTSETPGDGDYPSTSFVNSTTTNGAHTHNVTIGTASPSSIDNRPVSKKMYAFVYLGE
jgi:hypothetical protein